LRHEIEFAPQAIEDLEALDAHIRGEVRDAIATHLRHEPKKTSKSRIKPLRGLSRPQYRLLVGDIRVFYDVGEKTVEILAIVAKAHANEWLKRCGEKS